MAKILLPGLLQIQRPVLYHCEEGWKWQPAPLPDFDLWLVLAGRGWLEIGGETQAASAGTCFLFQPGDQPKGRHDATDPLLVFACHFHPGRTGRASVDVICAKLEEMDSARRSAELAVRAYESGPAGKRLATTVIGQMVAHLLFALERKPARLSVLEELAANIRARPGSNWTIAEMARRCAMSVSHFNRRFRQMAGCAPAQFVIRQRVLRAASLLRESGLSIQQAADALGYNDIFFFHRQFRRVAGITPRAAQQGAISRIERS